MSDRTDAFDRWRDWAEKPLDSDLDDPSAEPGDLKGSFDGGSLSAWRRESPAPLLVLRALGRQRGLYGLIERPQRVVDVLAHFPACLIAARIVRVGVCRAKIGVRLAQPFGLPQ